MTDQARSDRPWHRQFWPWFLIALPTTAVVASLYSVSIAFRHADAIVVDNYYQEGRAINVSLALDDRARELALSAELAFDRVSGEVLLTVIGVDEWPETLALMLFHPADPELDQVLTLAAAGGGRYRADLDSLPAPRYGLRLQPLVEPDWRLNGKIDLRHRERVTLTSLGSG